MLHHLTLGDGRPVLILHGATLDHRHMMASLEPVFDRQGGWKRIYVDLPGHGQSPPQDSIKTQDDLLHAVMGFARDVLAGERFAIIGESRGSYLAQGMVHLDPDPVTGVALIVPGGSPSADPARLPPHEVLHADPALQSAMTTEEAARFNAFWVVQRRDILEKSRSHKYPARRLWDAEQASRVDASFDFSFHTRRETSRFDGPSLIVAGRQDYRSGYLDAMDLMPQFPRATLAVLDTAGHGLAWERPELFAALLCDWLGRLG